MFHLTCMSLSLSQSLIWIAYARDEPRQMSSISQVELAYLETSLGGTEVGYVAKLRITDIPVKAIVTNSCFWGLIATGFCCSVLDFVVFNMLPKYLSYVHNYTLESIGVSSAIIWGTCIVFVSAGTFTIDSIINKWFANRRTLARQLICIVMIMPSLVVCSCLAANIIDNRARQEILKESKDIFFPIKILKVNY